MTENERILVEAVKTMLDGDFKVGLDVNDDPNADENRLRGTQYLHQYVDGLFRHKALDAKLTHVESICAAFSKIHSYRYVTDHSFGSVLMKELRSMGVPRAEQDKTVELVEEVRKDLDNDLALDEAGYGFNPNLDEIFDACKPDQYEQ